jgi:hypothetical protein
MERTVLDEYDLLDEPKVIWVSGFPGGYVASFLVAKKPLKTAKKAIGACKYHSSKRLSADKEMLERRGKRFEVCDYYVEAAKQLVNDFRQNPKLAQDWQKMDEWLEYPRKLYKKMNVDAARTILILDSAIRNDETYVNLASILRGGGMDNAIEAPGFDL